MAAKPTPAKTSKAVRPAAKPGAKTGARRNLSKPQRDQSEDGMASVDNQAPETVGQPTIRKAGGPLRMKDLIDQVSESSGVKKKDVKTVVMATLVQMGAALARGEAMSLVGLGHLRVARNATEASPVMTLKLRSLEAAKGRAKSGVDAGDEDEKDTLAEDSDQG